MALDILIADSEQTTLQSVGNALRARGHRLTTASDGAEAMELVTNQNYDLIIADLRLPKVDGAALLAAVRRQSAPAEVILMTPEAGASDAVAALRQGAAAYLVKPVQSEELFHVVDRVEQQKRLQVELNEARAALAATDGGPRLVGRSQAVVALQEKIATFAQSDAPVLITGESGTGKKLVARLLHERGPRAGKPFVTVSCGAFPEAQLEAELFGYERGAFSGAMKRREGRIASAEGGTLFLDDIAEMPLMVQTKLHRLLQEGAYEPMGASQSAQADVHVISATHRDLKQRIAQGSFREDLYYRLKTLHLEVPALRERKGDLPLLVEHFLRKAAAGRGTPTITPRAWAALTDYAYPGNVRELEHALQHAAVLSRGGEIDLKHLPAEVASAPRPEDAGPGGFQTLNSAVREFEREYLLRALRVSGGKKMRAAQLLGISRKSLWEKLRAYGVSSPRPQTERERERQREREAEQERQREGEARAAAVPAGKGPEL